MEHRLSYGLVGYNVINGNNVVAELEFRFARHFVFVYKHKKILGYRMIIEDYVG